MKKLLLFLAVIGIASSVYYFQYRPRVVKPQIVQTQSNASQYISPKEAQQILIKGVKDPNLVLIDVRTPEEFAQDSLINSINIDYSSPDLATKIASLDKEKVYILYCKTGVRSSNFRDAMISAGINKVYSIEGGIEAWREAKLPTNKPV